MTFLNADKEFSIRYYLWATSELQKEIDEAFPNLRSFKVGSAWKFYKFMQQLDRNEQLIFAGNRLKKFHPKAVKALGESCSAAEDLMGSRFDVFRSTPSVLQEQIWARQDAGEKIKFASKSKLRKTILTQFKEVFGRECLELACIGLDPELDFKMKCCGWILNTHFEFGGNDKQIHYWHDIRSETTIGPHGMPAMVIGVPFISFNYWLAISGQTQWEYLMDADIEPVCNFVIEQCRHFFEVAPKLLKGLEFENIT